ncbi:MAG TPA: polyprenyl synthetase family protein [Kofleriaceae bacterium]|nr:polyprenyl synthetase family protein [Kofleriaceae bacterium]
MAPQAARDPVLSRLASLSIDRGIGDLGRRLLELEGFVRDNLQDVDRALDEVPRNERMINAAAHHLLDLRGKHLRPMCVALASRLGSGFSAAARQLALAVELVHTATLLHDDVVDEAVTRRGRPTARVTYGNAASIFAGDWLLVGALQRVRATEVPGLLDRMLAIIEEMIIAESHQLERRGRIDGSVEDYLRIIEGKTAALFRWAMFAGARAGGLTLEQENALEQFGLHLGVAFQAVDDALDYGGDVATIGKDPGADLREGKLTYPLIVALDREPRLSELLHALVADGEAPEATSAAVTSAVELVRRSGALEATRAFAQGHVELALEALACIEPGMAKDQLLTVAVASLGRTA